MHVCSVQPTAPSCPPLCAVQGIYKPVAQSSAGAQAPWVNIVDVGGRLELETDIRSKSLLGIGLQALFAIGEENRG